jgi:hypothetical protein
MEIGEIFAVLIIMMVGFALLVSYAQFHRCKECKRLFAGRLISKNQPLFEDDDKEDLEIEMRHLKCKYCDHEWTVRFPDPQTGGSGPV